MRSGSAVVEQSGLSTKAWALLRALHESTPPEAWVGSQAAVDRASELLRTEGPVLLVSASGPWFGFQEAFKELEVAGLAQVDVGAAQFHAPGTAAPILREVVFTVTGPGRAAAESWSPPPDHPPKK